MGSDLAPAGSKNINSSRCHSPNAGFDCHMFKGRTPLMKQPTPHTFVPVISQPFTAPNLYKRAAKTGVGVSSLSISILQSQKRALARSWQRFDTRNPRRILLLRLGAFCRLPPVLTAVFVDDKVESSPRLSTTVSGPSDYLPVCK